MIYACSQAGLEIAEPFGGQHQPALLLTRPTRQHTQATLNLFSHINFSWSLSHK